MELWFRLVLVLSRNLVYIIFADFLDKLDSLCLNYRHYMTNMSIARTLKSNIENGLKIFPVVLINGARQSGKSTIAKELINEGKLRNYISLDDPLTLSALLASPVSFLDRLAVGTVIDEIQRASEIFTSIKYVVDKDRVNGRFLLTGSANILLLPKLSDSLAGRINLNTLRPLSQGEIEGKREDFIDWLFGDDLDLFKVKPCRDLFERVVRGGYPKPVFENYNEIDTELWYKDYLQTLLIRDVRDVADIEQIGAMPLLLKALSGRVGNVLNYTDLSRTLENLNAKTLSRYIQLLQTLYLVEIIPAWYSNYTKRLIKSPKVYMSDIGFAMYLLGVNSEGLEKNRILFGNLLENFVILEIQKQLGWNRKQPQLYYLRTSDGQEIDIVLEDRTGKLVAIEVKASSSFDPKDLNAIKDFRKAVGDKFHRGIIFHTGQEVHKIDENLYILPIQALWEERVRF